MQTFGRVAACALEEGVKVPSVHDQSCVPDSDAAHTAAAPWVHGAAVADAMRAVSFVGATSGSGTVEISDELERATASYSLYNFQSDLDTITTNDGRYRMIAYVGVTGPTAASHIDWPLV